MPLNRAPIIWTSLWVILMAVALITRPLLPVDETRYLAVAWEMWRDGNFLVPHLNGETYSHKPPLLFWSFHAGWALFGVNEWWPRLVAPLFGLGSLFLTSQLAHQLWPNDNFIKTYAPIILLGCVFWTLFSTITMFDMILAFWTLLALIGIVTVWRGDGTQHTKLKGFTLIAIGIGFGLLTKGPAILLHTLPVALLAPLWVPFLNAESNASQQTKISWLGWYGGVIAATLIGAAIVLAWALPAADAGGEKYANAIFWGQSAGRIVDSFAHNRPWWWYLAVLIPLTLPWAVWPRLWRAGKRFGIMRNDGGIRFCLSWFAPAFIAFSLISGKQLHYLLPIFPALVLYFARLLSKFKTLMEKEQDDMADSRSHVLPAAVFMLIGILVLFATSSLMPTKFLARYEGITVEWALLIILVSGFLMLRPIKGLRQSVFALMSLSIVFTVAAHLILRPMFAIHYDISSFAKKLGEWERQGIPLAHMNKYHGQYHFLGRLNKKMPVIGNLDPDMKVWVETHPNGKAVSYHYKLPTAAKPVYTQPYKGKFIAVWDAKTMSVLPNIARRN